MLRNYTLGLIVEPLYVDTSELKHYVHPSWDCLSSSETDSNVPVWGEQDLLLLTHGAHLVRAEKMDPTEFRQRLLDEKPQSWVSGQCQAFRVAFCGGHPDAEKASLEQPSFPLHRPRRRLPYAETRFRAEKSLVRQYSSAPACLIEGLRIHSI